MTSPVILLDGDPPHASTLSSGASISQRVKDKLAEQVCVILEQRLRDTPAWTRSRPCRRMERCAVPIQHPGRRPADRHGPHAALPAAATGTSCWPSWRFDAPGSDHQSLETAHRPSTCLGQTGRRLRGRAARLRESRSWSPAVGMRPSTALTAVTDVRRAGRGREVSHAPMGWRSSTRIGCAAGKAQMQLPAGAVVPGRLTLLDCQSVHLPSATACWSTLAPAVRSSSHATQLHLPNGGRGVVAAFAPGSSMVRPPSCLAEPT